MSYLSRTRRKRKRNFDSRLKLNNGLDRKIGIWNLIDIHEIPKTINYGDEFDFWCSNGKDSYLLRLRKTKEEKYSILKTKGGFSAMYLIADCNFENLTNDIISKTLDRLNRNGIPKFTFSEMKLEL